MTDGPGLGGYPELKPPQSRVPQAYRAVWFATLEALPRHLRTVQKVRKGLRALPGRKG